MATRRLLLKSLVLAVLASPLVAIAQGEDQPSTGQADLKETLTYGLKPRTPEEAEFIDVVVSKVNAAQLPLELVISTYRWAGGRKPYPFPAFQRALILRAAQIGVTF